MAFLKSIWRGNSKHKKLCEEWALASARESDPGEQGGDAVTFVVKYLGSTLVETPSSETATADAIKTVITMAKASGRKLPRVALSVSLRGIRMVDLATDELHLDVSIYRISYCSADATYDHVFAFIATNSNETMECHAFLCPKRKMAQAVTLTVAQSFNTAYELWQMTEGSSEVNEKKISLLNKAEEQQENIRNSKAKESPLNKNLTESKSLLIDFSEPESLPDNGNTWVCFDDDRSENLNSSFSRLSVTSPQKAAPLTTSPQHHINILTGSHNSSNGTTNTSSNSHPWGEPQAVNLLCS
ncbi:hypothetical protein R5R35_009784 [Gryllus longicercus]|uniref:PID domain-containing protein n=1 Tax=Gryllus longicercus TaxID=2509291 RepID=A0AAN9Z7F8_9ORTH